MKRILIIDDEPSTLTILSEILVGAGYEVIAAATGEEGLEIFEHDPADLVITDMVMPVRDGLDTILELKKKEPDLPIIAISAGGTIPKERYLEVARYMDNTSTLEKPFTSDEILQLIKELFAADTPGGISLE